MIIHEVSWSPAHAHDRLFNSAENNHVYTVMGDIATHVVVFCSHISGSGYNDGGNHP